MGVILIVDDEPVTQLMLGMMLQRSDYEVIMAMDGQDAIDHLNKEQIDLVISDVNMPKMDGLTMLQQLRADKRYQNLPVIMFTARGEVRIRQEAKRNGATEFLTKPASSSEVTGAVAQYLDVPFD
ncbi:MAG: response regulator [Chloroflexi bacterium]|nr:response regulator [Chloroflexota bacterium]